MSDTPHIIRNAILTPDGTVIESKYRHDYVTHVDANGFTYMVDGGKDYLRRTDHMDAPYVELSVHSDSPHVEVRDAYTWGSFGVNGDEPMKVSKLKDLDTDHISAILAMEHVKGWVRDMFSRELEFREGL